MHSLVIHFHPKDVFISTLLSSLLKMKGSFTSLQLSSNFFVNRNLNELFHFDTHLLLINRDFINSSELLFDFLSANQASDKSCLIIPLLLEDLQPFPINLGKSNRFILNRDYSDAIEFILDKIECNMEYLLTKPKVAVPDLFEATNWN